MNRLDLENACLDVMGLVDASRAQDRVRQRIRDAINQSIDEIHAAAPDMWTQIREDTLSLVNGTSDYTLNDWCKRPLAFYTVDTTGRKIFLKMPRQADRDGSRNTNNVWSSTSFAVTFAPRSTSALITGSASSATEGATSITGLVGIEAAHIGRMIRLNGEDADYKITLNASSTSVTVDKAVRARLTGTGVTGTGGGYSSVKYELGPPGRIVMRILPTPNASSTLYYRYSALPRRLINANESPEMPVEYHHLIWKGAMRHIALKRSEMDDWQSYAQEFSAALKLLKASDTDDVDNEEGANYASSLDNDYDFARAVPPGTDFRGGY